MGTRFRSEVDCVSEGFPAAPHGESVRQEGLTPLPVLLYPERYNFHSFSVPPADFPKQSVLQWILLFSLMSLSFPYYSLSMV